MLSKKEIKDIQSLGLKKYRDETKLFVAEGPKIVSELMQAAPGQVEAIYAVENWAEENNGLIGDFRLARVSGPELERISQLQTPNKVVAVFRQFESIEPVLSSFSLYLDAIQDPGNFGTIIRIADWFGVHNVVCSPGCADLYNPKVVQSTMASLARVNVFYDEGDKWLNKQHGPMYAAALQGKSLYEFQKVKEGVLLIGNESKGLRKELMEKAEERITIPRKGAAESLNAAVATGIILSHLMG